MRYTCPTCGAWVKDKFFFGLLHLCLTDEEAARQDYQRIWGHLPDGPPPIQQVPSREYYDAILRRLLDAGKPDGGSAVGGSETEG